MGNRFQAMAFAFILLSCGGGEPSDDPYGSYRNVEVAPANSSFEFGPVDDFTDPVGLAGDPQGSQFLALNFAGRFTFATRNSLDDDWTRFPTGVDESASRYAFNDGVHLVSLWNGDVIRSDDDGETWTVLPEADFSRGSIVAIGGYFFSNARDGSFYRSADGLVWNPLPKPGPGSQIEPVSNGDLYYYSLSGEAWVSRDQGETWTAIALPAEAADSVNDFHAVVDAGGDVIQFAADITRRIFTRTNDGPWTEIDFTAEIPRIQLFTDAFWFDGSSYLLTSDGSQYSILQEGPTGWEVVYTDPVEVETQLAGFALWNEAMTVVFSRVGSTIVEHQITTDTVDTTDKRFEREHAEIRDVSFLEFRDTVKALISVGTAPGEFGDLDTPVAVNHEIYLTESRTGETWSTPRSLGIEGRRFGLDDAWDTDGDTIMIAEFTDRLTTWTSTDGGQSFTSNELAFIPEGDGPRPTIKHVTGETWFISDGGNLQLHSSDGGQTWTSVDLSQRVVTAADGRLLSVDRELRVYESADGGQWSRVGGDTFAGEVNDDDPLRSGQLQYVDGQLWFHCCGWQVLRLGDEWNLVDDRNDFEVLEVVGGHTAPHIYGNDEVAGEMVIRRQDASVVYVSTGLAGAVEGEHEFVDALYFRGAHIIGITDRDDGRLVLLRRDPDGFTTGR